MASPALVIESDRERNSLAHLHRHHSEGGKLSPGQTTKILHLLPYEDKIAAMATIHEAQAAFWRQWSAFRGGLEDHREPNFYHVVGPLGALRQYANFIDPKAGDLIIDLAGGSAAMADYFDKRTIAGYVTIDSNPSAYPKALEHLRRLGHPLRHVIEHDLTKGLPDQVGDIIHRVKPKRVRYISNWGTSYFDHESRTGLTEDCLDQDRNSGIPVTLDFNMLAEGKFNPEVLKKIFIRTMGTLAMKGDFLRVYRGFRALSQIKRFGRELPEIVPLWYPDEIKDALDQTGFEVVREDSTILAGQSVAMEIGRKALKVA